MNITEKNFDEEVNNNKGLVVLDFWAVWCGPCKMLAPIFEEVEKEYPDVTFGKVNVDDEEGLARRFGIVSIPTLIFIKDGNIVKKSVGYVNADELRALIDGAK